MNAVFCLKNMKKLISNLFITASILFISCNTNSSKKNKVIGQIKTENVIYKNDTAVYSGYVAFDSSTEIKRPVIFIIHEWWGQNDYVKRRANQFAELGYLAMAIDLYGENKTAKTVEEAANFSKPFYQNSSLAKNNYELAYAILKNYPQADTNNMAIVGFCFGGSMALEIARMGERVNGVVSFHGGLSGQTPKKDLLKAKVLICHGADDQFVIEKEVNVFKKQMDSIGADYKFVQYKGATHAFSNPDATEWGKKFNIPIAYNQNADTSSWNEMKHFFEKIFH
jgi:dienelactone hydrolase